MNGWPDTYRPPPFVFQKKRPLPTESHLQSTNDQGGVRLQYGSLGSVRLDVKGYGKKKSLRIKALGQNIEESKLDQLVPPVLVYPPTKPLEINPPTSSSLSLRKRTEATKRFLENQREPLHIPYTVLHQHLAEIQNEEEELSTSWNAYEGNKLACSWAKPMRWKKQVGLILAPTGSVGQELNISPIYWNSRTKESVYTPCQLPSVSLSTPICQIVSSPYHLISTELNATSPTIAIRIYSSSFFVSLIMNEDHNPDDTGLAVSTQLLYEASIAMTRGNRHMDIALSPWEGNRGIIVDSVGAIWEWTGQQNLTLRREPIQETQKADSFFRVAYGPDDNTVYLMSNQQIHMLDLAHPSKDVVLYDITGSTSYLTSFASRTSRERFESDVICFSTTESVSWVDRKFPKRALLSWEHFRAFDRSLSVIEVDSGLAPTTILASQSTNLMTAYTVSPDTTPVESLTDPYILSHISALDFVSPRQGITFFHHPYLPVERRAEVTMFELGTDLSIWMRQLASREAAIEASDASPSQGAPGLKWLPAFKNWAEDMKKEGKKMNSMDERDKRVVDMRSPFEDLFKVPYTGSSADARERETTEHVARMEQFFVDLETPLPGMITSREIAMLTLDTRSSNQTSNVATGTTIHLPPSLLSSTLHKLRSSKLGGSSSFRASVHGRVNELIGGEYDKSKLSLENVDEIADQLKKDYGIQHITSVSRSSSSGSLTTSEEDESNQARDGSVTSSSPTYQSPEKKLFASYACDLLAYDLSLSSTVYASTPINPPVDVDPGDELERATQAMSLSHDHPIGGDMNVTEDEPPALQFSFFRPKPPQSPFSRSEAEKSSSSSASAMAMKKEATSTPIPNSEQVVHKTPSPLVGSKTARMLMSSWTVGEDLSEYVHTDLKRHTNLGHGLSSNLDQRAPASSQAAIAARLYGEGTQKMYAGSSQPYHPQTQPYQSQTQNQNQYFTQTPVFGSTQNIKPTISTKMAPPPLSTVPALTVTPASVIGPDPGFGPGSRFTQSTGFPSQPTPSTKTKPAFNLSSQPFSRPPAQTQIQTQIPSSQSQSQSQPQSQDPTEHTLASTQIVRGPHAAGGRPYPGLGKSKTSGSGGTKMKKKRMGGF